MVTSSSGLTGARFGRYNVDLNSGELLRSGVRVPIQGQPFQVLRLLLEAEGKLVTREALRQALWPEDTFIDFELGVNTAVKKLRQALEDSAEHPRFIETLPKYGYRFMVPVEWVTGKNDTAPLPYVDPISPAGPVPPGPRPPPIERGWKLPAAVAVAALALLASLISLLNEHSYLSRTRLGTLVRRTVLLRYDATPPAVTEGRLTANPEDTPVTSAAISPDGKYLAYTDKTGFYLKQVANGETRPMPVPKGFDATVESWFPDSVHLVVSWVDDATERPSLWVISVMGGTPRQLTPEGSSARVSPDGKQIAFLKGAWDSEEIWLVEANGNGIRKVVDGGFDHFGPAAWAPDGKRFACVRAPERSVPQIETFNLTNGHSETILAEVRLGGEVAWVNGGRLIYSLAEAQPNQDDSNLWWVELDPRTGRPSLPARITNDRGGISSVSVTSDGKRLALLRQSAQADVYLAELEAQSKRLSTPRRFTLDERQDVPAAWTPDSKAVLILSDRDGPWHIFKQDIDQTQPELLVGGTQVGLWPPRLTPDGHSMLYLVNASPGEAAYVVHLMRIPLSGGPSQPVLEGPRIWNYQCARLPSTVCVYGQDDAEAFRFFTFDPAGGKVTEVAAAKMKKWDGRHDWDLSPDGKYLVASSTIPYNEPALRIFNLADNTERQIPVSGVKLIMGVDWAPDSKSVWVGGYMGRGSWGTRSGLVNIDLTGKVRTLLKESTPDVMGATPSPDGRRLALGVNNTNRSNAWLLENF